MYVTKSIQTRVEYDKIVYLILFLSIYENTHNDIRDVINTALVVIALTILIRLGGYILIIIIFMNVHKIHKKKKKKKNKESVRHK